MTSPTPYDPPLSYGGWLQSRALGVRISSLLRAPDFIGSGKEETQSPVSDDPTIPRPTPASSDLCNRYNVIVHSSPYLRCLQTAIAVSAGLNQHRPEVEVPDSVDGKTGAHADVASPDPRTLLRVDAFLGEWLSPDYFAEIMPPPSSDRMVASAKTELLRRGEIIATTREDAMVTSGHFPGGWGSQSHPTSPTEEGDRQLSSRGSSTVSGQAGQRQRASTYDTLQSSTQNNRAPKTLGRLRTDLSPILDSAYVPPTPGYAVSTSDPIPAGYVAHARDACTKIDYQWDSMRTPFWGTGGEYGEEWSNMHERVHDGFRRMVEWYCGQGSGHSGPADAAANGAAGTDSPAQTVIIIVTHGADCNALISCLAGRSMLLDINTASLTMAVRRDRLKSTTPDLENAPTSPRRRDDRPVSQQYALQLVASTDHLRAGANPSQLTSLTSSSGLQPLPPPPIPTYRNRLGSRSSALQGAFTIGPSAGSWNSSRSWSLASRPAISTSGVPRGASGLWGSLSLPAERDEDAVEDDFVPNFGDPRPVSRDSSGTEGSADRTNWSQQLPQRNRSQRGLWGSAPSLEDRDTASLRRWTMAEQKL